MVVKVNAWKACDGTVHPTEEAAKKYEFFYTVRRFCRIDGDNIDDSTLEAMYKTRGQLFEALAALLARPGDEEIKTR